jgi:nitrite reductase (NO-forming)
MQSFNPMHLIAIIGIIVIGAGLIFKGAGTEAIPQNVLSVPQTMPLAAAALAVDTVNISKRADDIPSPIARTENKLVEISLETQELVAEIMPGVTYKYWTYNGTVPGPLLRVREGDDMRITLNHGIGGHMHSSFQVESFPTLAEAESFIGAEVAYAADAAMVDGHTHSAAMDQHAAEGHSTHSIDLHAVTGPGGGAMLTQVGHDGPKTFQFKATHPGVYVYHCASPHVPTHIANGMYGLIVVEPKEGLNPVDKEFYVMQGDFYTKGSFGQLGHQEFDLNKLLSESPSYFAFNGRVGGISGDRALKAKVGERIRMFVGVGSHIASNFHIIGEVFDNLYSDGAITNEPLHDVQTTIIPPGGAIMIEFTVDIPGKYLLVDHSLTRSIDKGALAELIVEGPENPDEFKPVP